MSIRAMRSETKESKRLSAMNCRTNSIRDEPIVFFTPISFIRFSARAVVRFIKLIHATSNIKKPNVEKM